MGLKSSKVDVKEQPEVPLDLMRAHNLELTPAQLKELMQGRGKETVAKLKTNYGGMANLCRKLDVALDKGQLDGLDIGQLY